MVTLETESRQLHQRFGLHAGNYRSPQWSERDGWPHAGTASRLIAALCGLISAQDRSLGIYLTSLMTPLIAVSSGPPRLRC